jgi:hypothetical protein
MRIKRPKKTLEDDLCDLLIETKELTKQIEEMYNNYMVTKFGESPVQHLTCDSCKEEK